MRRRALPLVVFLLALAITAWRLPGDGEPRFAIAAPSANRPAPQPTLSMLLPAVGESAHSATLAELSDGNPAAAWFAGSREGAADVAIYFSRFDGRNWGPARKIVERATVRRDTGRLIRKLGNPVLWRDPRGTLHCWFVSVSYGGWAGSSINHMSSRDDGATWSRIERLVTSPFLNLSTLVRNPPLPLADGGLALPVYHEFIAKRPEWLRLDDTGRVVDKRRLPGGQALLQPSTAALDATRAVALMRDATGQHRIHISRSDDGGASWSVPAGTDLPNPDAGIALLRLADGALLLAYNPQTSDRNQLALAISHDGGTTWTHPLVIEQGNGPLEFSYPALMQDRRGLIHLAYTWQRKRISYLRFTPTWVEDASR